MLSQLSQKSNQLPSILCASDQKSPYLLQYKVFEERLKRQEKGGKPFSSNIKNKKTKSQLHQDYIELTRNILSKKQNLNLLEDLPLETEPSISHNLYTDQLAAKTRMLFEKKVCNKKIYQKPQKQNIHSQSKQNINSEKSRVRSQSNTHILKHQKTKDSYISFIGYKRNKKPIVELGFKKILDFC